VGQQRDSKAINSPLFSASVEYTFNSEAQSTVPLTQIQKSNLFSTSTHVLVILFIELILLHSKTCKTSLE